LLALLASQLQLCAASIICATSVPAGSCAGRMQGLPTTRDAASLQALIAASLQGVAVH
jgi:hypothetical protein